MTTLLKGCVNLSCASRKMPRSPCLADKAPVLQAIRFQNSARGTRNLTIGIWNPVPAIRNPQRGIYNPRLIRYESWI